MKEFHYNSIRLKSYVNKNTTLEEINSHKNKPERNKLSQEKHSSKKNKFSQQNV